MATVGFFLISFAVLLLVPLLPPAEGITTPKDICIDRCGRSNMCGAPTRVDRFQTLASSRAITGGGRPINYDVCICSCIRAWNARLSMTCAMNPPNVQNVFPPLPARCPARKRASSVSAREQSSAVESSSSRLHQVSGFSMNEAWFLTRVHEEARLYDGSQIDCSVAMCPDCPVPGYLDLASCGKNRTAMWEYNQDVPIEWELIKPDGDVPIMTCTALVVVPANVTKAILLDRTDPEFYVFSADETELVVEPDYKVREVAMSINIVGVLNQEAFWTLAENCTIDEDELLNRFDMHPGTDDAQTTKRSTSTEGSFTFTVRSSLTEAQFNLLSQNVPISGSAFVPAASSGVAAGTIVGAVIGSVAGAVLLTAVVGGAAVAGRTYIVRRRRNLNPNAPTLDPTEMEDVSSPAEQNELADSSDEPKPSRFSVKVMGNREHAGSLTMRNPTTV